MSTKFRTAIAKAGTVLRPLANRQSVPAWEIELAHVILVGTHHKTGTAWMAKIFQQICECCSQTFYSGEQDGLPAESDVFFQNHSRFDRPGLARSYRGLHIIRDPRDRIISGCFYHQKAAEPWLHIKREHFDGMSYQEKLNSYESVDDRIMFEMENAGKRGIEEMVNWNYDDPAFFEVKYEDLIADTTLTLFHKIFVFLGYPGEVIPDLLRIAYDNSLFSGTLGNSIHIRSGKPKQWEAYFTRAHKDRFVELFGDALVRLGYENNNDWVNR